MNKFWTGSELAMNKFLFKPVKQIELLNLFNRGSNRLSSGLDLTDSGWVGVGVVGVLDEIKAISAQLSWSWGWGWALQLQDQYGKYQLICLINLAYIDVYILITTLLAIN